MPYQTINSPSHYNDSFQFIPILTPFLLRHSFTLLCFPLHLHRYLKELRDPISQPLNISLKMRPLPPELLICIFERIDNGPDRRNFLLVCQAWYALLSRDVYSKAQFRAKPGQYHELARLIRQSPHFRDAIYNLYIEAILIPESTHDNCESDSEQTGFPDDEIFQDLVKQLSEDQCEQKPWEEELRDESDDAWLALVLAQLPNLQRLDVKYRERNTQWVSHVFARVASGSLTFDPDQPVPLQRLQAVTIRKDDDSDTYHPADDFFSFFQLPSMRELSAPRAFDKGRYWSGEIKDVDLFPKPPLGRSGIRKLVLDCAHGGNGMAEYITACANLEVFEYSHECWVESGLTFVKWQPDRMYKALQTQKHSLQVLRLTNDPDACLYDRSYLEKWVLDVAPYPESLSVEGTGENEGRNEAPRATNAVGQSKVNENERNEINYVYEPSERAFDEPWFGSLHDFLQLRELRIPLRILLDFYDGNTPTLGLAEVLPKSLEHLFLGDVSPQDAIIAERGIRDMVTDRQKFPAFQKLGLGVHYGELYPGEIDAVVLQY